MFQLQPASGEEKASQALGEEGGKVPDPPKNSPFPTRDSFKGAGLSWDAQRPVTVVGEGEACTEGAQRGCGRWQWGPGWLGGPGCGSGDPFVAGLGAWSTAAVTWAWSRRSGCHLPRP